jgi:hypothetical protein
MRVRKWCNASDVPAYGHADLPPCSFIRIAALNAKTPDSALFRRGSLVLDKQLDGFCIILFCGMLPLIWSFDHFYFWRFQRFPDLHGRAALSARPGA